MTHLFAQTFILLDSTASVAHDDVLNFANNDPYGGIMALIGMGIVFIVLFILFVVFTITPGFFKPEFKDKLSNLFKKKKEEQKEEKPVNVKDLTGEVNAAIAAAIYLYRTELHDYENTILTISKVSRSYSPWSSKIYGLRKTPH